MIFIVYNHSSEKSPFKFLILNAKSIKSLGLQNIDRSFYMKFCKLDILVVDITYCIYLIFKPVFYFTNAIYYTYNVQPVKYITRISIQYSTIQQSKFLNFKRIIYITTCTMYINNIFTVDDKKNHCLPYKEYFNRKYHDNFLP